MIVLVRIPKPGRTGLLLATLGPPAGAVLLYLGLLAAARFLTGGELGYAGNKLIFGLTALVAIIGFSLLASASAFLSPRGAIAALGLMLAIVISSPTVALQTEWWDRTDRGSEPHAIATVAAIRNSSADLPIRCLPSLGTQVSERTKWAMYFCIRVMEEGFNGAGWGYAGEFLRAEGPTFEDVIAARRDSQPSDYFFAYEFTLGPGWFGWSGLD
jgi:hypothetical protein